MKIQNKKEIVLSVEDVQTILFDHLTKQYKLDGDFNFNFVVARKQIPSQYPSDSYDRHEFDGVKIVVTHD
jgi:hypothetical protein